MALSVDLSFGLAVAFGESDTRRSDPQGTPGHLGHQLRLAGDLADPLGVTGAALAAVRE